MKISVNCNYIYIAMSLNIIYCIISFILDFYTASIKRMLQLICKITYTDEKGRCDAVKKNNVWHGIDLQVDTFKRHNDDLTFL